MFFHFLVSTHLAVTLPVDPLWLLKFGPFWSQTDAKFTVKLVHKNRAYFWFIFCRFGIPYGVHLEPLLGTQNWAVSNLKCNQASEWVPGLLLVSMGPSWGLLARIWDPWEASLEPLLVNFVPSADG